MAVDPRVQSAIAPLVLLIDFADRPASSSPAISNPAAFDALFFGSGASDLSVRNYWNEVSYGAFQVLRPSATAPSSPDVVGWLRAGGTAPGGFPTSVNASTMIGGVNVGNVRQLLADAIASLSARAFDFSPYVRPSDSTFNAVIIVHPDSGQEDSGYATSPYSHAASIAPIATAAGNIVDYVIVPAKQFFSDPTPADPGTGIDPNPSDDPRIGAGVIVHEMGHLLGLPDLYPATGVGTVAGDFSGAGVFDVMGYGMWGRNYLDRPDNPAHPSAWSKAFLGWLTPTVITGSAPRTLPPVELSGAADKIYSNTAADPTQYFLVENREVAGVPGTWLFDKFLPGSGLLVWQIDEAVVSAHLAANDVNANALFRGVSVKEADGVAHTALPFPATGNWNDLLPCFGLPGDYFATAGQVFDRTNPSATVNSSPIVDVTYTSHPADLGQQVSMTGFSRTDAGASYLVTIGGAASVAAWRTFNVAGTVARYPTPMRSNDILSLSLDPGNIAWMGSRDQGIFRFLGSDFSVLNTLQGLPGPAPGAPPGASVAAIRAMASESVTGSMWVGTDRGLHKMTDSGTGYRVASSFTLASAPPRTLPVSESVQAIAVRRGSDVKYVGTPVGLLRVADGLTDAEADDMVTVILTGNVTAVAIDDAGTSDLRDDVVWAGFADGRLVRSLLPSEAGGPPGGDPVVASHFKWYTILGSPRVTALSLDKRGVIWIGTTLGAQAFDLGETAVPALPNLRDPYDFNADGNLQSEAFLNRNVPDAGGVGGSNGVTGIGFESDQRAQPVAWIGRISDGVAPGGASRFDANLANNPGTFGDERLKVYSPVPPLDVQTTLGRSASVSAVAGDVPGNVWLATTAPEANGVVRYGNAGVLSLDNSVYLGTTAVATAVLLDDGLNSNPSAADSAVASVVSTSDPAGFPLTLTETGPDTGTFSGTFGFTEGPTDAAGRRINVQPGSVVSVRYLDASPPGLRVAEATWKPEPPPRHFASDPVPQSSSVSFGVLARKAGRAAEPNDEIAAFCVAPVPGTSPVRWARVLVGWSRLGESGTFPAFPVYGDNAATSAAVEGCTPGQEVSLVLWSSSEGKEYHGYVDGASGSPAAAVWDNSLSSLAADLDFIEGTRIPLRTGAWNLFSYGVLQGWHKGAVPPAAAQLDNVTWASVANVGETLPLRSISGKYDRVLGNDGTSATFWNPSMPATSSLSYLAPGYGYWVKMKSSSQPLAWMTVPGAPAGGSESLALNTGWTLTGYWGNERTYADNSVTYDPTGELLPLTASEFAPVNSIGEIWSSLAGNYVRVTSFDGAGAHLWSPSLPQTRTLRYLGPGYGYWIKMSAPGTMTYPPGTR